ncbi:unnamed protein product [Clonostachys solani]|uniref:Uncharacterized protein n=1 Tax=Clonostachys solani TaxID=160281 RepID=A0A9N9Z7P0_9HYPO|nr:unnamed protein product [Clonostachys solani]
MQGTNTETVFDVNGGKGAFTYTAVHLHGRPHVAIQDDTSHVLASYRQEYQSANQYPCLFHLTTRRLPLGDKDTIRFNQ